MLGFVFLFVIKNNMFTTVLVARFSLHSLGRSQVKWHKLNLVKVQLRLYQNHFGRGITKPWYDKRTWRFLSTLIHSWAAIVPVSSLHFKLKNCTVLSVLLKAKLSGEFCLAIESISTILSAGWNKTSSSIPTFRFFGNFPWNGGST